MDASPLTLNTPTTGNPLVSPAPQGAASPGNSTGVGSFSGIFNTMQPPALRQDLAAWPEGLHMPSLVSQPLGDGLSVITPDAPSPAQDSLLAFARSQGLDEQAIAALWHPAQGSITTAALPVQAQAQTPPQIPVSMPVQVPTQANMGALLGTAHGNPDFLVPGHPIADARADVLTEPQAPVLPAFLSMPVSWTPATATPTPTPVSPSPAIQAVSTVQTPALTTTSARTELEICSDTTVQAQAETAKPLPEKLATVQLMGMVAMTAPSSNSPAPAPTTASAEPSPLTLSQLKIHMAQPELRTTKTPANPTVNETTAPDWSSFMRNDKHSELELLDLEADLINLVTEKDSDPGSPAPATVSPSSGNTLPSQNASLSNPQASSDTSATAGSRVISGFQLKAEHYQQLADRMGQALAQRLQQQIDRGEWSLRLRLNPVELGQIDVQLDMQQGGLNAVFQADNPLTRDLIQQGSGRLKEGLTQSGMTVASVLVNSDGSRQSGGNPTPQQQPRRGSSSQAQTVSANASPAVTTHRVSDNNWDMLA